MASVLTNRQRVLNQLTGDSIDRIPAMGGWIEGVDNLASIAGLSVDDYLAEPLKNFMKANTTLAVDCMIFPIIPDTRDHFRAGHVDSQLDCEFTPESLLQDAEKVPDTRSGVVSRLDVNRMEKDYRDQMSSWITAMGKDISPITTIWEAVPDFMMYIKYGYEAYLTAIGLYPEAVGKLYWESATIARVGNEIISKLIAEYDLPPVFFTGHDICNNVGPMCSLRFLQEYYFPEEKYAIEPFLEAGIRVIRHCDGNVMPIIEDTINAGYTGFQGFQYECGVDAHDIAGRKGVTGEEFIFFAGLNVTRTLPYGDPSDVREEIDYVLDYTDGGRGLFFFTSSSIGPEVPLANILSAYQYVTLGEYLTRDASKHREWPGIHKGYTK